MRKIMIYALLALLGIVLVTVTITLSNHLRKSPENIRADILKRIPIGTNMEDVFKIIEIDKKWEVRHINERGYGIDKEGRPGENRDTYVGVKSIRVHLGSYRNLFETSVLAYFGFDENSKLIDVAIRKDTDGL